MNMLTGLEIESRMTGSAKENYSWTTSGGTTPGHDAADRLTYWNRSSSRSGNIHTQEWPVSYGSTGLSYVGDSATVDINGTTQSRSHNAVHELTAIASSALSHDAKGNLTRQAGDTVDRYKWDFDNRMSGADIDQDGTNDLAFTYDAFGRRVSKSYTTGTGTTTTVFVCITSGGRRYGGKAIFSRVVPDFY